MDTTNKTVKFERQKQIILWLNDSVRSGCGPYEDIWNCPIATAVKQQLTHIDGVMVSPGTVNIKDLNGTSVFYLILGDSGLSRNVNHSIDYNITVPIVLEKIE